MCLFLLRRFSHSSTSEAERVEIEAKDREGQSGRGVKIAGDIPPHLLSSQSFFHPLRKEEGFVNSRWGKEG